MAKTIDDAQAAGMQLGVAHYVMNGRIHKAAGTWFFGSMLVLEDGTVFEGRAIGATGGERLMPADCGSRSAGWRIEEVPAPSAEPSSGGPPRRFYALTRSGRGALLEELRRMDEVVRDVDGVLKQIYAWLAQVGQLKQD